MPAGQPRKYKTVEAMKAAIEKYFDGNKAPTICGLALALGFSTRQSLLDYEGYDQGKYLSTLKNAKLRVESSYEDGLRKNNVAGSIFALKNFKWKDKQELNVEGNINITVVDYGKSNPTP